MTPASQSNTPPSNSPNPRGPQSSAGPITSQSGGPHNPQPAGPIIPQPNTSPPGTPHSGAASTAAHSNTPPPFTPQSGPLILQATRVLHTAEGPRHFNIRLQLETGRLLAIYGPSGAGKTTLLRILAGLTKTETGFIQIDNEIWLDTSQKINKPTHRRSIGFLFQDFALFPNLTVRGQLEYAVDNKQQKGFIDELLEMMELTALQHRKPAQLSGGQQQRVALARAIARKPRLLLLDEPLSALDDEMRIRLQDYILEAHRHFQLTTLLVTHHLPEIFRLADEVIVLDKGRIQRQGAPAQLFLEEKLSSTFQITGEIIGIQPSDIVYIISILSAANIVRVIATASEASLLHIGQKVLVASPAFNPILIPLNSSTP